MPLAGFICPDKVKRDLDECITCVNRCHSLAYLEAAKDNRKWTGNPSTTQSLNSVRMTYLQLTKPYHIDPEERAFAILGTWSHAKLDTFAKHKQLISELKLDGDTTGTLDKLEPDPVNKGMFHLIDHKTWGSYSLISHGEDNSNSELQLNHYRVKVETSDKLAEIFGFKINISKMFIEAIIRDGGTQSARMNKIFERTRMIEVERLDDALVIEYFKVKREALLRALETNILPPVCSQKENWNWRRCKKYCNVSEHCPEGAKINTKQYTKVAR